jgi:formylglycine-generating enzyme required for sulfatase activity
LEYCKWLSEKLDQKITLPTEAQWEFAARGGNKSKGYKYAGGNNINEVARYKGNSNKKVYNVASKKPNELGLYDMTGNANEWCLDWYYMYYYSKSPIKNPRNTNLEDKTDKIYRGGGFRTIKSNSRVSLVALI